MYNSQRRVYTLSHVFDNQFKEHSELSSANAISLLFDLDCQLH